MRTFTRLNPSTDPAATEDAFAEFAPEPAAKVDAEEKRDWFSEFPDEQPARPAARTASTTRAPRQGRATNWLSLSASLKDEQA